MRNGNGSAPSASSSSVNGKVSDETKPTSQAPSSTFGSGKFEGFSTHFYYSLNIEKISGQNCFPICFAEYAMHQSLKFNFSFLNLSVYVFLLLKFFSLLFHGTMQFNL